MYDDLAENTGYNKANFPSLKHAIQTHFPELADEVQEQDARSLPVSVIEKMEMYSSRNIFNSLNQSKKKPCGIFGVDWQRFSKKFSPKTVREYFWDETGMFFYSPRVSWLMNG